MGQSRPRWMLGVDPLYLEKLHDLNENWSFRKTEHSKNAKPVLPSWQPQPCKNVVSYGTLHIKYLKLAVIAAPLKSERKKAKQ